jgi:hypothetical protein
MQHSHIDFSYLSKASVIDIEEIHLPSSPKGMQPRSGRIGWLVGNSYSVSAANPQLCPAGRLGGQPTRCGR